MILPPKLKWVVGSVVVIRALLAVDDGFLEWQRQWIFRSPNVRCTHFFSPPQSSPQRPLPPSLSPLWLSSVAALNVVAASSSPPPSADHHPPSLSPLHRSLVLPPSPLSIVVSFSLPLPSLVAVVTLLSAFNANRPPLPLPPRIITLPLSLLSTAASSSLPLPSPLSPLRPPLSPSSACSRLIVLLSLSLRRSSPSFPLPSPL
ncbi:hypothetical protein ACLOJK_002180 [Asimina triloba]